MANPNILQGTLNKLLVSITWDNFPSLNITPSYLMPEGVDLTFEGQSTTYLNTLTGAVTSVEPYQLVRGVIHMIKAQALADNYRVQNETNTILGPCTIRSDSPVFGPYRLMNCSLIGAPTLMFAGRDAGYLIHFEGVYLVNTAAWP